MPISNDTIDGLSYGLRSLLAGYLDLPFDAVTVTTARLCGSRAIEDSAPFLSYDERRALCAEVEALA